MDFLKALPFAAAMLALQGQAPPSKPDLPAAAPSVSAATTAPAVQAPTALYRVTVVQGAATAINYRNLTSSTKVELQGTVLLPNASGVAKIKNKDGKIQIIASVKDMPPASTFGGEYLTYVLWGISPEGRAANLGELLLKNKKAKLEVSESLMAFGLVVTAEPYFAVTQPSDAVVMENKVSKKTSPQVELVEANYQLLKRGQYTLNLANLEPMSMDEKTPFDVYQARNAVRIARASGADFYAAEPFGQASTFLRQAESQQGEKKDVTATAREAIQKAEDARLIAVQRQAGEQAALERKRVEDQLEEARKQAAMAASAEAEAQKRAAVIQDENETLRTQLMAQLNAVLQTRATAKGLIVNMSGVLFKTGKATLVPAAREKLAKIAGILAAHKGLKIEANGYTDSTGTETFNRDLSEKRAMVTKDFLVQQGVPADAIIFRGFGEDSPIASNDSEAGRQENRRVELVVTGEGASLPAKQP